MTLRELVERFVGQRVVVVGDVILDEYLVGTATRMSREAPIPVLELSERRCIAGGAANPAANIAALGAAAIQISVIGQDSAGDQLRAALKAEAIDDSGLLAVAERATLVKTRVMAQMGLRFPQQVARVDTVNRQPIPSEALATLQIQTLNAVQSAGALLFSDYRGGILSESWVQAIRAQVQSRVLLTADAQGNLDFYRGFDLMKCNADDLQTALGRTLTSEADYAGALAALARQLGLGAMVVTRGAEGASLYSEDQYQRVPAPSIRDVFDTVGAGDTFIAVATLAKLAGATWSEAVQLGNAASGIVIQHVGNYTPSRAQLLAVLP